MLRRGSVALRPLAGRNGEQVSFPVNGRSSPRIGAAVGSCCLALVLANLAAAQERVLFEKPSPFNNILVTENERGLRTLRFERDGARQSVVMLGDPDHLELPYARVVPAGLLFVEKPQRVLIVGLGGGTVPSFLRKHFPRLEVDVVDIDPGVVDAAKKFFGFQEDDLMHAYVEDGRKFIASKRNRYDLILLDAFGADSVPYTLTTREFLESVRAALRPGGVAVGNIWSRSSNALYESMVRTYRAVFDELYIVDVAAAGNKILIALPRRQAFAKAEWVRRAKEFSAKNHFRYDLGDLVAYGLHDSAVEGVQGRILLDRDEPRKAE